jgi:hypothetical protein
VLELDSHRGSNDKEKEFKDSLGFDELEGPDNDEVQDLDRKAGDTTVYKYYLNAIGAGKLSVFLLFAVLNTSSDSFSSKFCSLPGRDVESAAKIQSSYLAEVVVRCSRPSAWTAHFNIPTSFPWSYCRNRRICVVRFQPSKGLIRLTSIGLSQLSLGRPPV